MRRLLYLFICLAALRAPGAAGFVMDPYLQGLSTTSVFVLVESTTTDTVTVQFSADLSLTRSARTCGIMATTASPATYVHRILLDSLSPGTAYQYRALQDGDVSAEKSFRTAVLPGFSFRFIWMSDNRSGPAIFDSVMHRAAAAQPLLALYGGDLCHDGSYHMWKGEFFRAEQVAFGAHVAWMNATGNHEGWTQNTRAFTCAPSGSGSEGYYSLECGDMHVLVLNSELPLGQGSPQYAFAERDLRESNRIWKLVILHKPAYCAGGHGEEADVKAMATAIFEKQGVDIVIGGHSHFYQHNLVNGIHHMVIGSAGAPLYKPLSSAYTLKSAEEHCWAVGDVSQETFLLQVYNEHGSTLDSLFLQKSGRAPAPEGGGALRDQGVFEYSHPITGNAQ